MMVNDIFGVEHRIENEIFDIESPPPPFESANLLFNALKLEVVEIDVNSTHELNPRVNGEVYFIKQGNVLIYQENPYVVIGELWNSFPIGIFERNFPSKKIKYELNNANRLYKISSDAFNCEVKRLNLEHAIIDILSFYLNMSLIRIGEACVSSSYELVRTLIIRRAIINNHNGGTGKDALLQYLQKRTLVSKSTLSKTISELKNAGYITIKNGVLISLDKKLPHFL
jgi:DNA-binding MarR family transcriptional regulator